MSAYYIKLWHEYRHQAAVDRALRAVRKIDPSMVLVGPVNIPGNTARFWLERPNDGRNTEREIMARMDAAIAAVEAEFNPPKKRK